MPKRKGNIDEVDKKTAKTKKKKLITAAGNSDSTYDDLVENFNKPVVKEEASKKVKKKAPAKSAVKAKPETIAKSKQLLSKAKAAPRRAAGKRTNTPRLCGNGKPMPSRQELERMFADSIEESPSKALSKSVEMCSTPINQKLKDQPDMLTPNTLQDIAAKVLDIISNNPESLIAELDLTQGDQIPPPINKPKKKKKPEVPHIVATAHVHPVPINPFKRANIGKGGKKFGDDRTRCEDDLESDDEEPQQKRRLNCVNDEGTMTSIFNAKTDEILEMIKETDQMEVKSTASSDSNKTLPYDFNSTSHSPNFNSSSFRFSPIPSTSKDSETFQKNDIRFKESLLSDNSTDDVLIIDTPCETIVLDDNGNSCEGTPLEITYPEVVLDTDSQDVELVSYTNVPKPEPTMTIGELLNEFGNYNPDIDESDCEIVDVDNVLAENRACLEKFDKSFKPYNLSITNVDANTPVIKKEERLSGQGVTVPETPETPSPTKKNNSREIDSNKESELAAIVKNFFQDYKGSPSPSTKTPTKSELNTSSNWGLDSIMKNVMESISTCAKSLTYYLGSNKNDSVKTQVNKFANSLAIVDSVDLDAVDLTPDNVYPQSYIPDIIDITTPITSRMNRRQRDNRMNSVVAKSNNVNPSHNPVTPLSNKIIAKATPSTGGSEKPLCTPSKGLGDCPICMENLLDTSIASTICGHIFCMSCIEAALKTGGKKCPTCRKTLNKKGSYHQIFL